MPVRISRRERIAYGKQLILSIFRSAKLPPATKWKRSQRIGKWSTNAMRSPRPLLIELYNKDTRDLLLSRNADVSRQLEGNIRVVPDLQRALQERPTFRQTSTNLIRPVEVRMTKLVPSSRTPTPNEGRPSPRTPIGPRRSLSSSIDPKQAPNTHWAEIVARGTTHTIAMQTPVSTLAISSSQTYRRFSVPPKVCTGTQTPKGCKVLVGHWPKNGVVPRVTLPRD